MKKIYVVWLIYEGKPPIFSAAFSSREAAENYILGTGCWITEETLYDSADQVRV